MADGEETYRPRGVGLNWYPCFVCGYAPEGGLQTDMAAFVDSRESGQRIVAMFAEAGLTAHLDYRDFEPNWVQVKVGACGEHLPHLHLLQCGTYLTKKIDKRLIGMIQPREKDHH